MIFYVIIGLNIIFKFYKPISFLPMLPVIQLQAIHQQGQET